jgi:hypothetical protein
MYLPAKHRNQPSAAGAVFREKYSVSLRLHARANLSNSESEGYVRPELCTTGACSRRFRD